MKRRDRAALVHAYECLRDLGDKHFRKGELRGDDFAESFRWAAFEALRAALDVLPVDISGSARNAVWQVSDRRVRARLALYLRAILRADAGDYGPTWLWCTRCGIRRAKHCRRCCMALIKHSCDCESTRVSAAARIAPLWQSAPSTAVRPEGLRRRA